MSSNAPSFASSSRPSCGKATLPLVALFFLSSVPVHAAEDAYFTIPLTELVAKRPADRIHTHLCVTGAVASVRKEGDGDVHVRPL